MCRGYSATNTSLYNVKVETSLTVLFRRMARRGGVKRMSAPIYEDVRAALTDRLKLVSLSITKMLYELMF